MSQCQAPYRQGRIDRVAGVVATAVGSVAAAEIAVVAAGAAAGGVVGYDAAGAAVAVAPEQGMSQTWDWG